MNCTRLTTDNRPLSMESSGPSHFGNTSRYSFTQDTPSRVSDSAFQSFARNLLRHSGWEDIETFCEFEGRLNFQAGSDNQSDASGALHAAWKEIDLALHDFLCDFSIDIEPCPKGARHRFMFFGPNFQDYRHEYRTLAQDRFEVRTQQPVKVVSALHNLKLVSPWVGHKHDIEMDFDRYTVHCKDWHCYYRGWDFVVDFRLD